VFQVDRDMVVGQIMILEITSEFNGMIQCPMNMGSKNMRNLSALLVT
jgi:hypothetical protein